MKAVKNLSLILMFLLGAATAGSTRAQNKDKHPNIIFILTDDHRWDALGIMGNSIIQTPNLDNLAQNGVLFKNAYATTSICCVSRASILTGQYMSRHKIKDFVTDLPEEAVKNTYPLLLKNEGYKIAFIGKYGIGDHPPGNLYDYWSCSEKGQPPYWLKDSKGDSVHHTDSIGRDIKKFLNQFGSQGTPFCLSVSFKAPHELDGYPPRYDIQPEYNELYKNVHIPVPETADPKYWNSFPDFFRTDENLGRLRWKGLFGTPELFQENVKNYYRLITGVDAVVGNMVKQLSDLGIQDNTVIIFMGDNGFYLGEHGMEGKWYGHEESIRVPLIIYDPRQQKKLQGTQVRGIALNIDIAPTILSIAGARIPEKIQGINLFNLINDRDNKYFRKDFFYEHDYLNTPKLPNVEGVVSQKWKYMIYPEHGYEELYNIQEDPKEKKNLAKIPMYSKILEDLRKRYLFLKKNVI